MSVKNAKQFKVEGQGQMSPISSFLISFWRGQTDARTHANGQTKRGRENNTSLKY